MGIKSIFDLDKKVAVVTGGYGHLGSSICEGLAEAGAMVVVAGKDKDKFKAVFGKSKSDIAFVPLDISSSVSIKNALKTISQKFGSIDIFVNNAIYRGGRSAEQMSDAEWENGIDGTLNSVFRCIREVIPYMKKRKAGSIINISSMYGMVSPDFKVYEGSPDFFSPPDYGAAKAGVIQLTKYYATYLAKHNIRVNSISPGPFPSEKVQKDSKFITKLSKKTPLGRIGDPSELKGPVIFLASDASSYITGANLVVDGGWTVW